MFQRINRILLDRLSFFFIFEENFINFVFYNLFQVEDWGANFIWVIWDNFMRFLYFFVQRIITFYKVIVQFGIDFLNSHCNHKCKDSFMLIKKRARNVWIHCQSELIHDILYSEFTVFCKWTVFENFDENLCKIFQRKLVHLVQVWDIINDQIKFCASLCDWFVNCSGLFNLFAFNNVFLQTFLDLCWYFFWYF